MNKFARKSSRNRFAPLGLAAVMVAACSSLLLVAAPPESDTPDLPAVNEARGRARILHETVHATLQVVHLEYYREDEALKLPAATMKLVFRELAQRHKVELRWLAVNAEAMNVEHKPRDAFEKRAVEVLASGKDEYEQIDGGVYRLASTITLSSDCLKCHQPNRSSNKDRAAGLVISMPVQIP
jgi:hypothetical protein